MADFIKTWYCSHIIFILIISWLSYSTSVACKSVCPVLQQTYDTYWHKHACQFHTKVRKPENQTSYMNRFRGLVVEESLVICFEIGEKQQATGNHGLLLSFDERASDIRVSLAHFPWRILLNEQITHLHLENLAMGDVSSGRVAATDADLLGVCTWVTTVKYPFKLHLKVLACLS